MIIDSEVEPDKEQDIISRLQSPDNLSNIIVNVDKRSTNSGNHKGAPRIPKMIRGLIGEVAIIDGVEAAASAFGVCQFTANSYANGLTGNGSVRQIDEELAQSADSVRAKLKKEQEDRIEDKELNAHEAALDSILHSVKIVDKFLVPNEEGYVGSLQLKNADKAASIVSKLSRISTMRKNRDESEAPKTLIINAPGIRKLDTYEVMDITSKQELGRE